MFSLSFKDYVTQAFISETEEHVRRAPRVSPCASTSLNFNLDFKSFTLLPVILCALTN